MLRPTKESRRVRNPSSGRTMGLSRDAGSNGGATVGRRGAKPDQQTAASGEKARLNATRRDSSPARIKCLTPPVAKSPNLHFVSPKGCAYMNPQFQAAYPCSTDKKSSMKKVSTPALNAETTDSALSRHTNKCSPSISTNDVSAKSVIAPSTDKDQHEKPEPRASSVSTKHRPDPNFIEFVPVESEFPDHSSLPEPMAHLSPDDQMVNFYPVTKKGPNYLKYCIGWLSDEEKPASITECVRKYTSAPNWYCTEVNMALASDSPRLSHYGPYIRELKYSIGMSRMNYHGTVFRGTSPSCRLSVSSNCVLVGTRCGYVTGRNCCLRIEKYLFHSQFYLYLKNTSI